MCICRFFNHIKLLFYFIHKMLVVSDGTTLRFMVVALTCPSLGSGGAEISESGLMSGSVASSTPQTDNIKNVGGDR